MTRSARGTIPKDGVVSLLHEFESQRASGLLRFENDVGLRGEVWLRLGHVDPAQPEAPDGTDPVETFLALRGGRYEFVRKLPPLDGTEGTDALRTGSLGRHSVADLMNYAEGAGLGGIIRVERAGRVAEIVYVDGTLDAIYLDRAEDDVDQVFGWSDGAFSIRLAGTPSLYPPPDSPDTRTQARVVERDRDELHDRAEQQRPRAPSIAPPSSVPPRAGGTVRIVLLGGQGEALLAIDPERARARAEVEKAFGAPPDVVPVPRPVATKPLERRPTRAQPPRPTGSEPEPVVPLSVAIALSLLLFTGLAIFVAVLLRVR